MTPSASTMGRFTSGRIQIVAKEDISATLGRSPDFADVAAMGLGEPDRSLRLHCFKVV